MMNAPAFTALLLCLAASTVIRLGRSGGLFFLSFEEDHLATILQEEKHPQFTCTGDTYASDLDQANVRIEQSLDTSNRH